MKNDPLLVQILRIIQPPRGITDRAVIDVLHGTWAAIIRVRCGYKTTNLNVGQNRHHVDLVARTRLPVIHSLLFYGWSSPADKEERNGNEVQMLTDL